MRHRLRAVAESFALVLVLGAAPPARADTGAPTTISSQGDAQSRAVTPEAVSTDLSSVAPSPSPAATLGVSSAPAPAPAPAPPPARAVAAPATADGGAAVPVAGPFTAARTAPAAPAVRAAPAALKAAPAGGAAGDGAARRLKIWELILAAGAAIYIAGFALR